MLRKTLITLIVMLIPGITFSQQLSRDERLHIAFNNAMLIASYTATAQDGYDSARANLDLYDQNGAGHLYLLRQFPFSSLLGHRIFICENSFSNIMGKDSITNNGGQGLESYCFKQLDDKNYEITITRAFRNVEYEGDRRIGSLRIYINENEPETFSFIWYRGKHKVNTKLIKTADGNIRPHRFYDNGRLQKKYDPVYFDQYGRITKLGNLKYTYSADHNLIKRESYYILTITSAKNGNVEYHEYRCEDGKIETERLIQLKRGQLEEVPYYDQYKYDETSISGITKTKRYYLLFDRDDFEDSMIGSYWTHYITKQAYAQEQVERRRKEEEKAAKHARYKQMISEYNARLEKIESACSQLAERVSKLRSRLPYEYNSKYPYIYRTTDNLEEKMNSLKGRYIDDKYHGYYDRDDFEVLEWTGQRACNYMIITEAIRQFLDDPATKKQRKALEHLLEEGSYEHKMQILTQWLQNRGYNILTKEMNEKPELTRKYESYEKKINGYDRQSSQFTHDKRTIIETGSYYMWTTEQLGIPHASEELLCKCIKMQEFIIELINDDSMKEQREKLNQEFDATKSLYSSNLYIDSTDGRNRMRLLSFILEEFMKDNGISTPEIKDIENIKFSL